MEILQNNTIFKKNKGLKKFIACNLILFSFSLFSQDLIRSNNSSTIHSNSNLILHSIGQTIAPEFNDIIYFGFRSPLTFSNTVENLMSASLYPNPTKFFINIDSSLELTNFYIHSLDGKVLKKGKINPNYNSISIIELPKGVFIVSIYSKGNILALKEKVIKE